MKKLKPCSPGVINNNISRQTACKICSRQVRATPCSILHFYSLSLLTPVWDMLVLCRSPPWPPAPFNPKTDSVLCLRLTGLLTAAALFSECQLTNNRAIVSRHVALFTSSPPTTLWAALFLLTSLPRHQPTPCPIHSTPSSERPASTPHPPFPASLPPFPAPSPRCETSLPSPPPIPPSRLHCQRSVQQPQPLACRSRSPALPRLSELSSPAQRSGLLGSSGEKGKGSTSSCRENKAAPTPPRESECALTPIDLFPSKQRRTHSSPVSCSPSAASLASPWFTFRVNRKTCLLKTMLTLQFVFFWHSLVAACTALAGCNSTFVWFTAFFTQHETHITGQDERGLHCTDSLYWLYWYSSIPHDMI